MRGSEEAQARQVAAPAITRRPSAKRLRERIGFYFGSDAEIVEECWAASFNGRLAVVDVPRGTDLERSLVSLNADATVTRQSTMSLARPDRLVFSYERLMSIAFALVKRPRKALLLGLGGGAMARFLARWFPHCEVTIVEHDPSVIDIARRYFLVTHDIVEADAEAFLAANRERFDVVLVDIYDSDGFARVASAFWDDALRAVDDSGCLAVNWADPDKSAIYRTHALSLAGSARAGLYATPRGFKDNVVQFCFADEGVTTPRFRQASVALHKRLRRRDLLDRCALLDTLP
jgi:spermidine synthase